jgi:cellulose synthase/poly-beta-1,6-N-acetylglucosamine synthase-like glycosyltransferase
VLGIMDADGVLDNDALQRIAPLFADPKVGAAQTGVRILNAADGLLTRCQEIEFVGFCHLVQVARDRIGSVGLGGNGQFTRLSALRSVGDEPWTECLTEDLDLGLSLAAQGWRIRFCRDAWVAQQGVRGLRAWIRQRTRWTQGHYQCWRHYPMLIANRTMPLYTRVDCGIYLAFITFVMFVTLNLVVSCASLAGLIVVEDRFLQFLPVGPLRNFVVVLISILPICYLMLRHQQHTKLPLRLWELPAYAGIFSVYGYLWAVATVIAWVRMAVGRGGWAKTARVKSEAQVQ